MSKFKSFLDGVFGNESVKKALIWLLVVVVGIVVILTQFAFPTYPIYKNAVPMKYTSNEYFDKYLVSVYNHIKEDGYGGKSVLISDKDFDMSDMEDYRRIEISFDFLNIGMYKLSDIQFFITPTDKYKDRFVHREANLTDVNRFASAPVKLIFVMHTKGMSEAEMNEAISTMKLSYTYSRPELFGSGGEIDTKGFKLSAEQNI